MKKLATGICILFALLGCKSKETHWQLQSPDKKITINIDLLKHLSYSVSFEKDGKNILAVEPSRLGIKRNDMDFDTNLIFLKASGNVIDETYEMHIGKRKINRNHANELTLFFKNDKNAKINFVFRAYEDGIAFRYVFPESSDSILTITDELSEFDMPVEGKAWIQPYDTMSHWGLGYEVPYKVAVPIGQSSPVSYGWAFPMLFELNTGLWMLVSEADLTEQYCAMHIKTEAPGGKYRIDFPGAYETYGTFSRYPSATLPMKTPWRFIIIGDMINNIVESNLVYHLSTPNQLGDVSWVKPGISSWSWWSDALSSSDYIPLKDHVDLSHEMGWEYSLVDADWDVMKNGNIKQLADYANSKNVGLILWYNSGGPNNHVKWRFVISKDSLPALEKAGMPKQDLKLLSPIINKEFFPEEKYLNTLEKMLGKEKFNTYQGQILKISRFQNAGPRDRLFEADIREKEFAFLNSLGVKGIKADFFMSDMQEVIKLYLNISKDAAKHKIVVGTHGCTIPRGWSRTYPNLISMEAVMGEEMYGSAQWPKLALTQNTLYPFIRNVIGPMDYTPCGFSNMKPDVQHLTTYAHELALSIVFENGILHIAEGAKFFRTLPKKVQEFFKTVPTTWDDTRFIEGYPGKYTVLQRQKDSVTYIAGINGEMSERTINIPLNKTYSVIEYSDGKTPKEFAISEKVVSGSLKIRMAPAGGFTVILKEK